MTMFLETDLEAGPNGLTAFFLGYRLEEAQANAKKFSEEEKLPSMPEEDALGRLCNLFPESWRLVVFLNHHTERGQWDSGFYHRSSFPKSFSSGPGCGVTEAPLPEDRWESSRVTWRGFSFGPFYLLGYR